MSIDATTERPGTLLGRPAVPWFTVLPLAVALAYGDGFWMTSLRGAVGAIERTQGPFTSWLRESTLMLPLFVVAVLGALTLAIRRFGPVLATTRALLSTAMLIVAAGTVVSVGELAASSAYDYHLQAGQLQLMASMRGTCTGVACLAQQQAATLGLQVRAVGYGAVILLLTNLVLVGWVIASRGGRLNLTSTRAGTGAAPPNPTRVHDLRRLLAAGLVGSAGIHAAVVPDHLVEWGAAGVFFIALGAAEVAAAALLLTRPHPKVLLTAAAISAGPLGLWLYSRTLGIPFGPGAGVPEPIGLADIAATVLETATLLLALALLRANQWAQRPPASAHVRSLALVGVLAITAIGLAGSGLPWLDDFGTPNGPSTMITAHQR